MWKGCEFFAFVVKKTAFESLLFSLLSESLLWGKCNFPSSYLKVVREEKYAQRLFKEKRILIEFSAKQTFIHIKEFLITENTVYEKFGHIRPFYQFLDINNKESDEVDENTDFDTL